MYEWIEENFGDDANPDDEESWSEAVDAYGEYIEHLREREAYENAADEYHYYIHLTLENADERFSSEHARLLKMIGDLSVEKSESDMFYRMCYAQAVTIFEVYMEDMAKSLISRDDEFLSNYLRNSKALSGKKYSLKDMYSDGASIEQELSLESLRKYAIKDISNMLYHNINNVINTFSSILDRDVKVEKSNIVRVFQTRHDVVHRNGVNVNGKTHDIGQASVTEAMAILLNVANAIYSEIILLPER